MSRAVVVKSVVVVVKVRDEGIKVLSCVVCVKSCYCIVTGEVVVGLQAE